MIASGFQMDYTDSGSGLELPTAWVQITNIMFVPENYCTVNFAIYKDQSAYGESLNPVFISYQQAGKNDGSGNWQAYFDPAVMDGSNHDVQSQAIAFLQSVLV